MHCNVCTLGQWLSSEDAAMFAWGVNFMHWRPKQLWVWDQELDGNRARSHQIEFACPILHLPTFYINTQTHIYQNIWGALFLRITKRLPCTGPLDDNDDEEKASVSRSRYAMGMRLGQVCDPPPSTLHISIIDVIIVIVIIDVIKNHHYNHPWLMIIHNQEELCKATSRRNLPIFCQTY